MWQETICLLSNLAGMNADEKECPYCFEIIKARAIKCRFCGSDLRIAPELLPATQALETSLRSPLSVPLPASLPTHISEEEVLLLLTSLVEKNLVIFDPAQNRYRLLETVRQYGSQKLDVVGDKTRWQNGHRNYFLELAEEANPRMTGPKLSHWLDVLEAEHDNLRQAISLSLEGAEGVEEGLRLGYALHHFWKTRGYLSEGREWMQALLARPLVQQHTGAYARALFSAGALTSTQGDYFSARSLHQESLKISQELGDKPTSAMNLMHLGIITQNQGDYTAARSLYEQSLAIRQELGDRYSIAAIFNNLGNVAQEQRDYPAARAYQQESLLIQREFGDEQAIAISLNNLGILAGIQCDYPAARSLFEESLAIRRTLGDRRGIASSLNNLGMVAFEQGAYSAARSLYEEGLAIRQELGNKRGIASSLINLGNVAVEQLDYTSARSFYADSLIIQREIWEKPNIAAVLQAFASLNVKEEKHEPAVRLWGASQRLREEIGYPLDPIAQEWYDDDVASVRQALGEEAFTNAWKEGHTMPLEQAIEYALSKGEA